jgi:hypothetical protein
MRPSGGSEPSDGLLWYEGHECGNQGGVIAKTRLLGPDTEPRSFDRRQVVLEPTFSRELTEMVKNMPKLDWTQRESVRASLRRNVRRLLARYGYPPDLAEGATQLVLRQAKLSTESAE